MPDESTTPALSERLGLCIEEGMNRDRCFLPSGPRERPSRTAGRQDLHGTDGFRAFYLDWLAPSATHRMRVREAIARRERVLQLAPAFGRLEGSRADVEVNAAGVWTFRDGKVSRIEFYRDQAQAGKAAGVGG
jgi:ketosteroid isomerase-like protein